MAIDHYEQLLEHSGDDSCMTQVARRGRLNTVKQARAAFERIAPVVVTAMAAASRSPAASEDLMAHAFGLTWVERETPALILKRADARSEHSLTEVTFGSSLPRVTSKVAATEQIGDAQAAALLEAVSELALAVMAGDPNRPLTADGLAATLNANASSPFAAPVGAAALGFTAPGETVPEQDGTESKSKLLIGALVGLLALAGIGLVAFGGGDSDNDVNDALPVPQAVADSADNADVLVVESDIEPDPAPEPADPETVEPEPAEPAQDDGAAPADPEVVEADLANVTSADRVAFSVPMLDIVTPTRDASGVLNFNFDTLTGEVCYSVESTNISGPYRSHIHVGGYGVKGGIVVDLGLLESGEIGCVASLPIDTADILADRANHYAELHDVSEEWTIRGQLSETIDGDVVSLSVPMTDAEGINPDASGVLNFAFDTVTGRVCYSVESTNIAGPYRSHIHVGEAGVKGGIVVDLGALGSGDVGCVDNLPTDTNAILAAKGGHYAELHDVGEEFTIRGQLSESTVGTSVPDVPAQVDADGGGASIVLLGGTVFLQGAVPDQATADELSASLAGIDAGTPVVNELTVEAGAPLPSGRVVIADAVFFDKGSDEVRAIDADTLAAITSLALSRDDWVLTVVGHTDSSGSDVANLELSLRRATSLRDLLSAQGVPDENLRIRGAGETAPIGDNRTEEGRAQNRRIEFEFSPST